MVTMSVPSSPAALVCDRPCSTVVHLFLNGTTQLLSFWLLALHGPVLSCFAPNKDAHSDLADSAPYSRAWDCDAPAARTPHSLPSLSFPFLSSRCTCVTPVYVRCQVVLALILAGTDVPAGQTASALTHRRRFCGSFRRTPAPELRYAALSVLRGGCDHGSTMVDSEQTENTVLSGKGIPDDLNEIPEASGSAGTNSTEHMKEGSEDMHKIADGLEGVPTLPSDLLLRYQSELDAALIQVSCKQRNLLSLCGVRCCHACQRQRCVLLR